MRDRSPFFHCVQASFSRGGPEAGTLAAARAALAAPGAGTDFKQPQDPRAELLAHQVGCLCAIALLL